MLGYKIWDKKSDIFTPGVDKNGKGQWTAQEYIQTRAPWAGNPAAKVIISDGVINGAVFMEFDATVDSYKQRGAVITDNMADEEILAVMQAFDKCPPEANIPTPEERIAAALEFNNILQM